MSSWFFEFRIVFLRIREFAEKYVKDSLNIFGVLAEKRSNIVQI